MLSLQASTITPIPEMKVAFDAAVKGLEHSFEYPPPSGDQELREQVKLLLPHWKGDVLITNSATEATYLALSVIAGGKLALNVPSYFGVLRQAKDLGIDIVEWETVEDLERIEEFDAILLTSNFTPPTGLCFSDADKDRIAHVANEKGALVIEDNAYEFLRFDRKPLTAIPADRSIKLNSFSKLLTPSLRLGFLVAEGELFKQLRSKKITMNLSSSIVSQKIVSRIIKNRRIIENWQRELKERATMFKEAIKSRMGIDIVMPEGGSFIKLPLNPKINSDDIIAQAKTRGLLLDSNKRQYLDGRPQPYLRLHLGAVPKNDIKNAIKILSKVLTEVSCF